MSTLKSKMHLHLLRRVILLFLLPLSSKAQYDGSGNTSSIIPLSQQVLSEADSAWVKIEKISFPTKYPSKQDTAESILYFLKVEYTSIRLRELGISFWNRFPEDNRRFIWFEQTLNHEPNYWDDPFTGSQLVPFNRDAEIQVDKKRINEWNLKYQEFRKEFYSSSSIPNSTKLRVLYREIDKYINKRTNPEYLEHYKFDLNYLKNLVDQAIVIYSLSPEETWLPSTLFRSLYQIITVNRYNLSHSNLTHFFKEIARSPIPEISSKAAQALSLVSLFFNPIQLNHHDINGDEVDLNRLKGKVILLDFWGTWCGTCISRMKYFKGIHEKYKEKGFELISLCINSEADLDEIREVEKRIGAHWPLLIIGGKSNDKTSQANSLYRKIWDTYGFSGVPQLILLDKKGLLAEYQGVLLNGNLEPVLNKLLQ